MNFLFKKNIINIKINFNYNEKSNLEDLSTFFNF
jgi:hypothetical protein